jgi:hypothetical protein
VTEKLIELRLALWKDERRQEVWVTDALYYVLFALAAELIAHKVSGSRDFRSSLNLITLYLPKIASALVTTCSVSTGRRCLGSGASVHSSVLVTGR